MTAASEPAPGKQFRVERTEASGGIVEVRPILQINM